MRKARGFSAGSAVRAVALGAALCAAAYLVPFYYLSHMDSWVAALMFTVPPSMSTLR